MNTNLKPVIVALGLSLTLALVAGQAQAFVDPATLLPANTDVQFKYNDLEVVVSAEGDVLHGIFDITSIGKAPTGSPSYWASDFFGLGELTGRFDNLTVAEILGGTNIYFTGGTLSIFSVAPGTYTPSGPGDSVDSQICGGACGPAWLTMNFVPGGTSDLGNGGFDESLATLFSTVSGLATPLTGTGDSVLQVTGGTAAGLFGIGNLMSLQSNLQSCPDTGGAFGPNCVVGNPDVNGNIWPIASFDPVVGTTIPEPGTLLLLGAGLLGIAGLRRKSA